MGYVTPRGQTLSVAELGSSPSRGQASRETTLLSPLSDHPLPPLSECPSSVLDCFNKRLRKIAIKSLFKRIHENFLFPPPVLSSRFPSSH